MQGILGPCRFILKEHVTRGLPELGAERVEERMDISIGKYVDKVLNLLQKIMLS